MTETPAALLFVDPDRVFTRRLASEAGARGYRVGITTSIGEAIQLIDRDDYHALVVDIGLVADGAVELSGRLSTLPFEMEVIIASEHPVSEAIAGFDCESVTFVRKTDNFALFVAVARAVDRRRVMVQNRRLMWELQTINQLAPVLTKSLELDDVLTGALLRLMSAMTTVGGAIQLHDALTNARGTQIVLGPRPLRRMLTDHWPGARRPSDDVIATGAIVTIADLCERFDISGELPLRSVISVPMLVGNELLGSLTLAAKKPGRFDRADQEFLTVVAGQIAIAVQNALLHRSIHRAKREWEQTVDAITDSIAVFNGRGELLRGNRALAAHLALPVTAIRQLTCREIGFCDSDTCADCAVTRALAREEVRAEVTLADGQIFSVTTFPIGVPSEGPSVVQVASNVTVEIGNARRLLHMSTELSATNDRLVSALEQLKSAQTQLVQAEKLSALGQLVAGVAHELNNPLTSVIGYAQLVERELRQGVSQRPAAEVAQDLGRIANESERAARIVRNLLAFARRQSAAARASLDVVELCARVIALRQYELRASGTELRTDFAGQLPRLLADGGQLQQVLLNLMVNAEQAMRDAEVRRLTISAAYDAAAEAIELSVGDSGHGIKSADLPRIFDPFFTTREVGEGSGLGLSICYGIVRDHGGHIRAESQRRRGTTVTVTLPAFSADPCVVDSEVLIAHSEPGEREYLAAALGGWGYRTVTAATAREALEICRRPAVDLAVVDGQLVAEDLRAWHMVVADDRRLAVVMTAVPPDDSAIAEFSEKQAMAVLTTPIELRALRRAARMIAKECV